MDENAISKVVLNLAIRIHQRLGPGLLESVYEVILAHELTKEGLSVSRQQGIPIRYDDVLVEEGFRADLIVNDLVMLELKAVEKLHPVHAKQLLTYLRLSGLKLGLLINFNEALLKDGVKRVVNGLAE